MTALAIALTLTAVFFVFVYGRAIVYACSEEYKLVQRLEQFAKR
jgi:hypothetical protein